MGMILNTVYGFWKWLLAAKLKIKSSVVRNSSGEYLPHDGGEKLMRALVWGVQCFILHSWYKTWLWIKKWESQTVESGIGWWVLALDLIRSWSCTCSYFLFFEVVKWFRFSFGVNKRMWLALQYDETVGKHFCWFVVIVLCSFLQ